MKFAELKNKNEKELKEILSEKREEMRDARFKVSEGQLKNISVIKKIRKAIARIMTLLNKKQSVKTAKSVQNSEEKNSLSN